MIYRREIDGLRAVAVVPVIFFHAGLTLFSGGYVGVDVFFVISGYLITSILVSELEQGNFSIARFYERRARRILPALFFVILCCIPFAWMWMLPSEFKDFSQSIVAVVLFVSNILFWREEGYFAPATELKPLLHTWSLAVEEQYYLLFPIFLLLAWRFGRNRVFWSICLIAAISLAASEWGWRNKPSANFYLAPTRAWEFLAGSMCAFWLSGRERRANNWLSLSGLALIVFAIFYYDEATPFPSVYALAPVLGTALIIVFGGTTTWAAKLLSMRGFVGIGLISYSAYLWHQPLFAFARIRNILEPSPYLMAVLSLVLAYFSWRYVEKPFRNGQASILPTRRSVFVTSGLFSIVLIVCGINLDNENSFYSRLSASDRKIISFIQYKESAEFKPGYRYPDCFYGSRENDFSSFKKGKCLHFEEDKKNYLIMGDSHAAHFWLAFVNEYPEYNFLQATASGCKPLLPLEGEKYCTDLVDYIVAQWISDTKIDGIILSALWDNDDASRISRTIQELKKHTDNIIILGPTVEYTTALPKLLMRAQDYDERSSNVRRFVVDKSFETEDLLKIVVERSGGKYVKIASNICNDIDCIVYAGANVPMTWDYGHFTLAGAAKIVRIVDPLGSHAVHQNLAPNGH